MTSPTSEHAVQRHRLSGTVLITWPDYGESFPEGAERLHDHGLSVRYAPKLGVRTADELDELLGGAVAAIVSTDPFSRTVLESHPQLRIIARVGIGFDSIDVATATRHGVAVTVTTGASEATVADHAIGLMLATIRDLAGHSQRIRDGKWLRTGPYSTSQLTGATVLIIGYGLIGRQVRSRLRGFDVHVLVHDPYTVPDDSVEFVSLEEGLRRADVVTLHVPLTEGTRNLIGRREFGEMKPGSILVNLARGGVVDEAALYDALVSGPLRAAGMDVFATEPPVGSALLELPQVVLTPHVGGVSQQSIRAMLDYATNSVVEVLSGRRDGRTVNPEAYESGGEIAGEGSHD